MQFSGLICCYCNINVIIDIIYLRNIVYNIYDFTGVLKFSSSPVALVCQTGDQLELTCNTTSGIAIDHRWEFTIFPENVTHTPRPLTTTGVSGIPPPLTVSTSTITFSRLSGTNDLSLISRVTVNPVNSTLNGTVVKCVDVDTDSVATTTIYIIGGE